MNKMEVSLCGIELRNPLIVSSGPLTWGARGIKAVFDAGAAGAVTKTIRPEATVNPVPHIAAVGRGSMLNTEGWSDLSAQQWIEEEFPALRERDGVLIASLGHTAAEVRELAAVVARAGVDMLELVSYRAADAAPMLIETKKMVDIPVLIKVSPNWANLIEVVDECVAAGADGITAIDSVGPTLHVDVETGKPVLGSFAWLSGAAIRPIALRAVAEICLKHDVPVVGTGGVGKAEEVVEMMMAGAAAVGVHTAPLLHGVNWFGKTLERLARWLDERNHAHLADLRGVALPHLREAVGHERLAFTFDAARCTRCQKCVNACGYAARVISPDKEMTVDAELCRSCGLCVTVCLTGALGMVRE